MLNNLNATYSASANDDHRGKYDIDNLWCMFEAEVALAANLKMPLRLKRDDNTLLALVSIGI